MANQNKPTVRDIDHQTEPSDDDQRQRPSNDEREQLPHQDRQSLASETDDAEGSDTRTPEEIEAEQREQLITERQQFITETSRSQGRHTTTEYSRAVAEFDPDDTDPQLGEMWEYLDREYEQDGHF